MQQNAQMQPSIGKLANTYTEIMPFQEVSMPIGTRMVSSYTTYNVVLMLLYLGNFIQSEKIVAWLQGNSLLIAVTILLSWTLQGSESMIRFYRTYMPNASVNEIILFDFLIHFTPVIVLGLPRSADPLLAPWMAIATWYIVLHSQIKKIYMPWVWKGWYEAMIFGALPIFILIYHVVTRPGSG